MRAIILLASLGCSGCEAAVPDDGSVFETRYVRYVSAKPFVPCGGLARETDQQVEYLFDFLGEPYPAPQSIEYEWVEDKSMLGCAESTAGCAHGTAEGAAIESIILAHLHELAHAAHELTIGNSHRVLTEGFASYASGQPGSADPQDVTLFTQAIEEFITAGVVPLDQYPLAARFIGMTIERHGIGPFKAFWRKVPRNAQLEEFRATYEASFGVSWSDALAAIASREQTLFSDLSCEGDVQVVGDSLKLTFSETCEDEVVTGPLRNFGVVKGEFPVPIELTLEGMYRFRLNSGGGSTAPVAGFRGCRDGGPAPEPAVTLFVSNEDVVQYLGPGRYLLNIYVPLAPGDSPPIDVLVERIQ
jgi:hypothetical protein